jgi:mono/diheme cytochrome c family protein
MEMDCLTKGDEPRGLGESCVRCHGSESPAYRYLNDFELWRRELAAGQKDAKALVAYLKGNQPMPPVTSPEHFEFAGTADERKLREFLRQNR